MYNLKTHVSIFLILLFLTQCSEKQPTLQQITVSDFEKFVAATNYETDAERFGWTFIQKTVLDFEVVHGIDWRCPEGVLPAHPDDPVTQVSYKDAKAYTAWSNQQLPDYQQYWALAKSDKRKINSHAAQILPAHQVNIVGNTWDITLPDPQGRIRLAGGSFLCNPFQCNGTNPERVLHIDHETGNSHISFSVY